MEHFTPGSVVDVQVSRDVWRRGFVRENAPYHLIKIGGAYVRWDFEGRRPEQWESEGGWHPAHAIRLVQA